MKDSNGNAGMTSPVDSQTTEDLEVDLRLTWLERRLRDTQQLIGRVYEQLAEPQAALEAARSNYTYELAYGDRPLVSIRTAVYKAGDELFDRALASIRNQTYDNWEAILVGDGWDEGTSDKIAAIGDSRIKFYNLPYRGPYPSDPLDFWYVAGMAPANHAIELASGSWLAALDQDDEWQPNHLETLMQEARSSRAEIVYGKIRIHPVDGTPESVMGAWPPERGQIGWLAGLQHAGLKSFRLDPNCRFVSEPADWNLARRLWDAGAKFSFVDRELATSYFSPKSSGQTLETQMIQELREWSHTLENDRNYWRNLSSELQAQRDPSWTSKSG